jgi:hypothetical protein
MHMPADDELYEKDELHKIPETSARFRCSERYTWDLIEAGELDVIRHGRAVRVTVASENRYLEKQRQREIERRAAKAAAKTRGQPIRSASP